jgi:hypothetical protein
MSKEFDEAMKKFWASIHKDVEPKMETLKEALRIRAEQRSKSNQLGKD